MRIINCKNANEAWRKTLSDLIENCSETDNDFYWRDEMVVIELSEPSIEEPDKLFPMKGEDLKLINNFVRTGEGEDKVVHPWTRVYYHRIFDEPNSQIKYMIEMLKKHGYLDKTIISLWDKDIDQKFELSPCTLVLWSRIKNGRVEFHVHAHSSDAYKKLLMNLQEYMSIHEYVAEQVGLPVGGYYHILDSCHIHGSDRALAEKLIEKF